MVKHVRQPKYPIILGGTLLPIALGLISQAIDRSQEGAVDGFMVMAGIGVGLTFGPLSIHARFSQPSDRVAVVVALNLFFRSLGGTIGLAQCGTIVNARVRSFFEHIPASAVADLQSSNGTLTSFTSADLTSLTSISSLPQSVQDLVKDAFRDGVRWAFVSLIPWACLSLVGCLFLGKIANSDEGRKPSQDQPVLMQTPPSIEIGPLAPSYSKPPSALSVRPTHYGAVSVPDYTPYKAYEMGIQLRSEHDG